MFLRHASTTAGWAFAAVLTVSVAAGQQTSLMSVDSSGAPGNNWSMECSISANGRFVAFRSKASNLVPGDTNWYDIFVHDRQTGATTRVSVDSAGNEANGHSYFTPSISGDGALVAFNSEASNLVAGDTNNKLDIFVRDRTTATTTRVSVDTAGGDADSGSYNCAISLDGRYVAFDSIATDLVPGDLNGWTDVFVRDLVAGTTERVSLDSAGSEADLGSFEPAISADGRFVAFHSSATNLVAGDTNGFDDVFVHDRQTGTTTRVNVDSSGAEADNGIAFDPAAPSISADGRFVSFESYASNLVPADGNGTLDVFVHDLQTGATTRVSVDSSGVEGDKVSWFSSISGDGRWVAFESDATNLVAGDTNHHGDVFVHDRQTGTTTRWSVSSKGAEGNYGSSDPAISADGWFVSFESLADNLVPGDWIDEDIFARGPWLTLEADPEAVAPGATLTLTTWTGEPSGLALLAAVDLNGVPTFLVAESGAFDPSGIWTLTYIVPSGLSGNSIDLQVFGIVSTGKAAASTIETITFQ